MTLTPTDTSTWLPLDGLAPGFDANKAEPSHDLDGREITIVDDAGLRIVHRFGLGTVDWSFPGEQGSDSCEVFRVDDDLYYAQFHHASKPTEAVSLFLDLRSGRALSVVQTIGERQADNTAVAQYFAPAVIEALEISGEAAAPTTALTGRRVLWEYSPEHAYEHVYLSPRWYTWQCLAGPERGLADTDQNHVWQLRPGIYVFTWREKVIPCASVTVADHRNARAIRSHGVLFGLDETGTTPTHFTFGAHGRLISTTVHPDAFEPAA